jgi:hypothetical protein
MRLRSHHPIRRAVIGSALALLATLSVTGCSTAVTESGDGELRVRVDRSRGSMLISNLRRDSVLVGTIGRKISAVALRIPCGNVRLGPQRTATFEIPARETEVIVIYCALPLPANLDIPPERTFIVNVEN